MANNEPLEVNSKDVFKRPYTIFQQKVNGILTDEPSKDLILDLVELQMFKDAEKDSKMLAFVELYNLLGIEKFYEVMDLLAGKTIKFPAKDSFKETIQIALCYYYRHYMDLDWDSIKQKLGGELPSVKLGIKGQQLDRFLDYIGDKVSMRYKDTGGEDVGN